MRYLFTILFLFFVMSVWSQTEKKALEQSEAPAYNRRAEKSAVQLKGEYLSLRQNSYSQSGKHISLSEQKKLNVVLDQLERSYKDQYECLFVQMVNSNFNDSFPILLKAAVQKRETNEILPYAIAAAEIEQDKTAYTQWVKTLNSKKGITRDESEWARNLLSSVTNNAYLFTYGYKDTYPLLILQETKGIRTDVKIINIEWLQNDSYRKRILNQIGVSYTGNVIGDESNWIRSCKSSRKKIYFASSIPGKALQNHSDQLYNTGLAFFLSDKKYDNIKVLENNWQKFEQTQMFVSGTDDALKSNYLFGLVQLYNHYKFTDKTKSNTYLQKIKKIGAVSGKSAIVDRLIKSD